LARKSDDEFDEEVLNLDDESSEEEIDLFEDHDADDDFTDVGHVDECRQCKEDNDELLVQCSKKTCDRQYGTHLCRLF